jgi:hypothetical protein
MICREAFLGMGSASSRTVSAGLIVAAHADWEDDWRYVKRHGPSLVMQVAMNSGVSVDVARVHCPRYWTRRCWQSATLDNKKCKKNIKIS